MHLTPTSSSWLNQVERFFALLTDKTIRRGVYRSVAALRADIASFIDRHNADPKPFRWTADDILARALLPLQCLRKTRRDVANFWFRTLGARHRFNKAYACPDARVSHVAAVAPCLARVKTYCPE